MEIYVSVAIPTYRRLAYTLDALRSIIVQQTDCPYEVLVLDNGCDPTLQAEVERVAAQSAVPVRYIPVWEVGLHSGRHAGAREADGDLLVFVDDDLIASSGWLAALAKTFDDPDVHLVGGPNLPQYESDPPDWLEAFWAKLTDGRHWCGYLSLLDFGNEPCDIDPNFVWGVNFAIRKKTLEMLGGFNPDGVPWELRRYRGDGESAVTRKAKALGLKAIYQPGALVYHRIPKSRLTVEYFERRAHLQGISDSYTAIRRAHGLDPLLLAKANAESRPDRYVDLYRRIRRKPLAEIPGATWRWLMRKMRRPWQEPPLAIPVAEDDPYINVRRRVAAAYQAGYEYHQAEVRNDPALLEWVLRSDYWDGRLPSLQNAGQESIGDSTT